MSFGDVVDLLVRYHFKTDSIFLTQFSHNSHTIQRTQGEDSDEEPTAKAAGKGMSVDDEEPATKSASKGSDEENSSSSEESDDWVSFTSLKNVFNLYLTEFACCRMLVDIMWP